MRNYTIHSLKLISFVTILTFMLACGSSVRPTKSEFASASQNLDTILKQANQAEPNEKNPLLLQASDILLANARYDKALEILLHIDVRYLNNKQKDTHRLFYGEALLLDKSDHNPDKRTERNQASLGQLLSVTAPNAHSIEWQIRYFQSLSDSYFANNNYYESAKQRIDLDDLIDQQSILEENNEKIWMAISHMNNNFLEQMISNFNSKRVNGWLEIVHINQKWGNQPDRLLQQMDLWKKRYPLHPAMLVQPQTLKRAAIVENITPKKIAVLLPLSGRLAQSGKMVHDGLIAAHYQQSNVIEIPTLSFYDTNKSLSGLASYQQAINDGADFVIGPINKKAIDEIIMQDSLATPILFLNTSNIKTSRHQQSFQFVFSIEDKAIQAAHRAWEKGYRKAIAFVPDNTRGKRARDAFQQYFEQLGGELIDTQEFGDIKKLKNNVQNLLLVNSSIARKKQLEKILGRNIESKIRRRQDADFIFMISTPQEARRIKPFINFYFALDLPVISTERVYSGTTDPQLDNDLNGIEFSDIPLYISQQPDILKTREVISNIAPNILKRGNGRLFSLGFDAYQIISQITKLQAFPNYRWYGLSGEIGINENGLVHRYLTWAEFKNGAPQVTKERLKPVQQEKSGSRFIDDKLGLNDEKKSNVPLFR